MEKKNKYPNQKHQKRLTFPERLAQVFEESGLGNDVEHHILSDNSGESVAIQIGEVSFYFGFDPKTKKLIDIGIYKDIVEVVGQDRLFYVKTPVNP